MVKRVSNYNFKGIMRLAQVLVLSGLGFLGLSLSVLGLADQVIQGIPQLYPGDVILLELPCQTCSVISASTNSPYSHSGLVVDIAGDQVSVAQSLTSTEVMSLEGFLRQAKIKGAIKILRPRELLDLRLSDPPRYQVLSAELARVIADDYIGQPFDDQYLWDNVDDEGREILYCSEMVQKTLNRILTKPIATVPMDFTAKWDFWERYYQGRVPQGQPGNSPASLERAGELVSIFQR
jgi:hypothetical protein